MPIPLSDLRFLRTGLRQGFLDEGTGLDLFLGMRDQAAQTRAASQQALAESQQAGLDALRSQALELTSGDTPISQTDLMTRLSGVSQMYGLPPELGAGLPGLGALAGSQQAGLDDEDKKEITKAVFLGKAKMPRGELYHSIVDPMRQQLGDAMFLKIRPEIEAIFNGVYNNTLIPEF